MTYEEIEKTLQRVADSHLVQAQILDRLDRRMEELGQRVEELTGVSHDHHEGLEHLAKACERLLRVSETHNEQLIRMAEMMQSHEQRLVGVEDQVALLRSTVSSVLQRMDAFIQGLQKGDGHSKRRK